jgi:TetR/AcrR family transcriptional regulator
MALGTTGEQAAGRRRPVGRPRSSGVPVDGSSRDQIVAAATRLFAKHGYANTTMTAIAEAAGLRQPSVYYWFRRKEDVLLATRAMGRGSLDYLDRIEPQTDRKAVTLYRLLRADTLELCLSPCDFNEIERAAEQAPDELVDFWTGYSDLQHRLAELIAAGVRSGELREVEPEITSVCLLALNEGAQKRFRNRGAHAPGGDNPFRYRAAAATEYAELVATTSVRSLLVDVDAIGAIRSEADRLDGEGGTEPV